MHCPRCGQQQSSSIIKFCSRCGFQLGLVGELLANDGTLPQLAELYNKRSGIFTKKNGLIFSVMWFIVFVMMFPALFGVLGADELSGLSAIFGLFSAMIMAVGSLAFLKSSSEVNFERMLPNGSDRTAPNIAAPEPAALHGQRTQPASSYIPPEGNWKASDTGEFAIPGSVTDGTTKLLKKDE